MLLSTDVGAAGGRRGQRRSGAQDGVRHRELPEEELGRLDAQAQRLLPQLRTAGTVHVFFMLLSNTCSTEITNISSYKLLSTSM